MGRRSGAAGKFCGIACAKQSGTRSETWGLATAKRERLREFRRENREPEPLVRWYNPA